MAEHLIDVQSLNTVILTGTPIELTAQETGAGYTLQASLGEHRVTVKTSRGRPRYFKNLNVLKAYVVRRLQSQPFRVQLL